MKAYFSLDQHWIIETARVFHAIVDFPSINLDYLTELSEPLKFINFAAVRSSSVCLGIISFDRSSTSPRP
jgi:hypothetical protein